MIVLVVKAHGIDRFEISGHREEYLRLTMNNYGANFRKAPEHGRTAFAFELRPFEPEEAIPSSKLPKTLLISS